MKLAFDQTDDEQQNHCADDGVDDRAHDAANVEKPEPRQQPAGDQSADDANDDVADQAEPVTLDDQAGEPARDRADHQPHNQIDQHDVLPLSAGNESPAAILQCNPGSISQSFETLSPRQDTGDTSQRTKEGNRHQQA